MIPLTLICRVIHNTTAIIEALRRFDSSSDLKRSREIFQLILSSKNRSVDLNLVNSDGESCASLVSNISNVGLRLDIIEMLIDNGFSPLEIHERLNKQN